MAFWRVSLCPELCEISSGLSFAVRFAYPEAFRNVPPEYVVNTMTPISAAPHHLKCLRVHLPNL